MQVIRPVFRGPLFITGAAGGLGGGIARLAASAGVALALLDIDEDALKELAREIEGAATVDVAGLACDVSDEWSLDSAVDVAVERLGPPAGLVTAAGVDRGGLAHDLDASLFDEVIAINLRGTFLACRACLRHMICGAGGAIVCVSSPLAQVATAGGSSVYSASKAAVSALVRSLAVDYSEHGIRVNAVLPGPVDTELMWAPVADEAVPRMREAISEEVPLGRLARPEEVARAAAWLLSDESSYVTGTQLVCDGGVLAKASISV